MAAVRFLKILIMNDALHFHTGSLINIFKVLFWEGGVTKKSTLCTLFIMLTILDDPSRQSWTRIGHTARLSSSVIYTL